MHDYDWVSDWGQPPIAHFALLETVPDRTILYQLGTVPDRIILYRLGTVPNRSVGSVPQLGKKNPGNSELPGFDYIHRAINYPYRDHTALRHHRPLLRKVGRTAF